MATSMSVVIFMGTSENTILLKKSRFYSLLLDSAGQGVYASSAMSHASPPGRLRRLLFRLPVVLHRARLGWLLGSRFLMLTHTGRISGLPRQTVLEVVHLDPAEGNYYLVAAYAERADWFRNITREPNVEVTAGRRTFAASAESLEHAAAR